MSPQSRFRPGLVLASVVACLACCGSSVFGQSIAYEPVVSPILNGAALTATPVVSADRLYVRMTLNPYFNTVNGFTTYSAPVGAVSGGGVVGGGGNLAGMNGVMLGGGGGGMGGAAAGGGLAGPTAAMTRFNQTGTYLAGDFVPSAAPAAGSFGAGDPFEQAGGVNPARAVVRDRGLARPATTVDHRFAADPFALGDAAAAPPVRSARAATTARRRADRKEAIRRVQAQAAAKAASKRAQ